MSIKDCTDTELEQLVRNAEQQNNKIMLLACLIERCRRDNNANPDLVQVNHNTWERKQ